MVANPRSMRAPIWMWAERATLPGGPDRPASGEVDGDAAAERRVVQLQARRPGARRDVVDQRPLDPVAGVDQAVQQPDAAVGGGGGGVDRVPPAVRAEQPLLARRE